MNGPTYVTHEEFEALRRELAGEVQGEKAVTRHILEQSRRNGEEFAAVKSRLDRVETKLDHLAIDVTIIKAELAHHTRLFDVLAQDMRFIRAALERREAPGT
jgi:hypothetical protein